MPVAQHQAAVHQPLLVGADRGDEARVVGIEEAESGQEQVRGIRVTAVERLREEAEPLVVAAREDVLAARVAHVAHGRARSALP